MNWFAYRLQKLNTKLQTALVIISKEGCGKNIVTDIFTKYIIGGRHSLSNLADARKITGTFNTIIENKLLIVANEFTSETKQYFVDMNIMKSNITDEEIVVEGKFSNCRVIKVFCAFIFLTNYIKPMKLDEDSRRYAVFNASAKYKGNSQFFKDFVKKFHNEEFANILYTCLLRRDLSKFDILNFPKTEALKDLIELSKNIEDIFLEVAHDEIEVELKQIYNNNNNYKWYIKLSDLYDIYKRIGGKYEGRRKLLGIIQFSKTMISKGFFIKDRKNTGMFMVLTEKYRKEFNIEEKVKA